MSDPIRVFVGCSANHEDVESLAVLEYSIRSKTERPVEITYMKLSNDPDSPFYSNNLTKEGWNTEAWATPFSGFRWSIPELCNFEGKAIYTDSDVIFMDDIAKLWDQEFKASAIVMAKGRKASWRYCVSLWNCSAARKWLMPLSEMKPRRDNHSKSTKMLKDRPQLTQQFEGNWNCLDGEHYPNLECPQIQAIHYTSMPHQPHLKYAISRLADQGRIHWFDGTPTPHFRQDVQELFDKLLSEALEAGYSLENYMQDPIFGPYVKKSVKGLTGETPAWGAR